LKHISGDETVPQEWKVKIQNKVNWVTVVTTERFEFLH